MASLFSHQQIAAMLADIVKALDCAVGLTGHQDLLPAEIEYEIVSRLADIRNQPRQQPAFSPDV